LTPGPYLYECCNKALAEGKLEEQATNQPDLTVLVCPEGHRHYELEVDPLELGIEAKGI